MKRSRMRSHETPRPPGTAIPAAPNNPGCGQIGAWGVGCEKTPVVRVSWREVRALFR